MLELDRYKLNSNEGALLSAEEMDAKMEAEEAAKLESLRETAEDFCDFVNGKTYFGGWSAEIVERKVLIVNDEAGDSATCDFELTQAYTHICHRGARSGNWFTDALTAYMADWFKSRAEMEAKKAAEQRRGGR